MFVQESFSRNIARRYIDAASSSERTCALVARLRARVQSPSRPADRASPIKPLILPARSVCVGFNFRPSERARFFSAMLRLAVICCCAAEDSAADSCGAMMGTSPFPALAFSAFGAGATCGRGAYSEPPAAEEAEEAPGAIPALDRHYLRTGDVVSALQCQASSV